MTEMIFPSGHTRLQCYSKWSPYECAALFRQAFRGKEVIQMKYVKQYVPVCLKSAICLMSWRRFLFVTMSLRAKKAGDWGSSHLFFSCCSSMDRAGWWQVYVVPPSSHRCTPMMWWSTEHHRRMQSWNGEIKKWLLMMGKWSFMVLQQT